MINTYLKSFKTPSKKGAPPCDKLGPEFWAPGSPRPL